ncbi:MAG TPA: hypothetical protein VLD16_07850 [Gaiellaceae bacterium]|nr:hypothetical protein [Gaiellaceae bacterium]
MTRPSLLLVVPAAFLAAAATSALGGPSATPTLKLTKRTPLQVQGLGFKLREQVSVTAASETTSAKVRVVVRTTARGTFAASLGRWNRCKAVTVKAVGARGDRATLVVRPPPPVDVPCWGI